MTKCHAKKFEITAILFVLDVLSFGTNEYNCIVLKKDNKQNNSDDMISDVNVEYCRALPCVSVLLKTRDKNGENVAPDYVTVTVTSTVKYT